MLSRGAFFIIAVLHLTGFRSAACFEINFIVVAVLFVLAIGINLEYKELKSAFLQAFEIFVYTFNYQPLTFTCQVLTFAP